MSKFKLGERVTVDLNRKGRKKRPAPPAARDLHHGPLRRIEDPEPGLGTPEIMLIDCSMRWQDFGDDSALPGNDFPLPAGVMAYIQRGDLYAPYWDAFYLGEIPAVYRTVCFNKDSVKLPPFSGTEYRKIERGMPLPFRVSDNLNLNIKLGSRQFAVAQNGNWKQSAAAAARLLSAIARGAGPGVIDKLQHEADESNFATGQSICRATVVPQLWFTHAARDQRDLWRDYGLLKPRLAAGQYPLAVDSPLHFEPFDVRDFENFKVVKRFNPDNTISTFDASIEVIARQLSVLAHSRRCKIYLIPQSWRFQITYRQHFKDRWDDHHGNIIYEDFSREVSDSGYMPAFASPFVISGWETPASSAAPVYFPTHPSSLHAVSDTAYDPLAADDESLLRFMMQLSLWQLAAVNFAPHLTPTTPSTAPPPDSVAGPYAYADTHLVAQASATAVVTQEGTPAHLLVGAIEFSDSDDARYFIYRKTARTLDPVISIYSGPYDDPGYNRDVNPGAQCVLRITSAAYSGSYPANRFAWASGGLCGDSQWAYLMQPRWLT